MKKIIVTIISVLMLFTASIISTSASVFVPKMPNNKLVSVLFEILNTYNFNSEEIEFQNKELPIKMLFDSCIKRIKENGGAGRLGLAFWVIYRLKELGIDSQLAFFSENTDPYKTEEGWRPAVLLNINDECCVIDLWRAHILAKTQNTDRTIASCSLQPYLKFTKSKSFLVLKNYPGDEIASLDKLEVGKNCVAYVFEEY